MPDDILRVLVMHELGHGHLASIGQRYERTAQEWAEYYEGGLGYVLDEEEEAVRDVLGRWGIDDTDIDRWAEANREQLDHLKR